MRRWLVLLAAGSVVVLAACSGGSDKGGGDDAGPAVTGTGDERTTTTLDQSPFCVTIRAFEDLGSQPDAAASTPDAVLAQNAQMTALLDEATASAPDDAPADVQAMFDDYQALSDAITAAAGDTAAAFATLTTDQPELAARLEQQEVHKEAFTFFADRCGTAPPP